MNNSVTESSFAIGDFGFRLKAASPADAFHVEPALRPFLTEAGRPDVELTVHYGKELPSTAGCQDVFDAEGNWKLSRRGSDYVAAFTSPVFEPELYKLLVIDESFRRGDIYVSHGTNRDGSPGQPRWRYPFQYPLDQLLIISLLSRQKGVAIHGLGVEYAGRGLLFTGVSGAGKSTTASLWKARPGARILSDERLIIRPPQDSGTEVSADFESEPSREKGRRDAFRLFGTPWPSDAGVCAYGGVNLERIVVLKQAPANRLISLSPAEAATALMVRSFPTFWDPRGMDYTLKIIGEICARVPCFELHFRPEQAALDTAMEGLESLVGA